MMAFHVGQKVTPKDDTDWQCIEDESDSLCDAGPRKGDIFTIKSMMTDRDGTWLTLAEWAGNDLFDAEAFSPVVERPTSIEIFTRMLTKAPKKESSNA